MIKLILIDDHKIILDGVSTLIASDPGISNWNLSKSK